MKWTAPRSKTMKLTPEFGNALATAAAKLVLAGAVTTTLTVFTQTPKAYSQGACYKNIGPKVTRLQRCDPANRFGNCSVQANRIARHPTSALQPVSHGTPYINQGKLQTVTLYKPHFQPARMRNGKALKPIALGDVVR